MENIFLDIEDGVYNIPNISRVEVIGKEREYVNNHINSADISIQDKGRTLKIFIQ